MCGPVVLGRSVIMRIGEKRPMKNHTNLTVFGSFGFGNLGDELVPESFRNMLSSVGRSTDVNVLSRFQGVSLGETAPYPDLADPSDGPRDGLIVLAGGGIVEPREMSCMNRAFKLRDQRPNLEIACHAISVEPGVRFSWRQRRRLEHQLDGMSQVNVRDVLSAEVLTRLMPKTKVRAIGDIALWMEHGKIPAAIADLLPDTYIPIVLGDFWSTPDFMDWLTVELAQLARDMNAALLLLPFSGEFGGDLDIYAKLAEKIRREAPDVNAVYPLETVAFDQFEPSVVAAIMQEAPLVVSMRLHGCVLSYAMQTPFVGLAYHPKLRGFAETVGWSRALVPATLPGVQSANTYGFAFEDIACQSGDLCRAAEKALASPDFSGIAYFRQLQCRAIEALLDEGP